VLLQGNKSGECWRCGGKVLACDVMSATFLVLVGLKPYDLDSIPYSLLCYLFGRYIGIDGCR
jgi:hypothetical protein